MAELISMVVHIGFHYSRETRGMNNPQIKSVLMVFIRYPLVMLIFWAPYFVDSAYLSFNPVGDDLVSIMSVTRPQMILLSFGTLYGAMVSYIFFRNSKEARQRWHALLCNRNDNLLGDIEVDEYSSVERYNSNAEEPLSTTLQMMSSHIYDRHSLFVGQRSA